MTPIKCCLKYKIIVKVKLRVSGMGTWTKMKYPCILGYWMQVKCCCSSKEVMTGRYALVMEMGAGYCRGTIIVPKLRMGWGWQRQYVRLLEIFMCMRCNITIVSITNHPN
jgi:hypothetical protein